MDLIIKTNQGLIEGMASTDGKTRIFRGVPYAEPPVGKLRFARPEPKKAWFGTRTCKSFCAQAWQEDKTKFELYGKEFYSDGMPPMSEDCLYLNIWTPAVLPEEKLPVLMWIHGGAYMHGYNSEPPMDGEGLAARGVIMVSINYRVGALGFFTHDDLEKENPEGVSGNYGMWDQLAALRWIYENIAYFGGDKEKITVAGQSAGCMSTTSLICSELSEGMISKAIFQSGGGLPGFARDGDLALQKKRSLQLMELLGVHTIEELRECPAESICYGAYAVAEQAGGLCWMPVVDQHLLKDTIPALLSAGKIPDISYMIGSTKDEMGNGSAELLRKSAVAFALNQEKLGRKPVYVYEFKHDLPGNADGAFHTCELWYEFETLDRCWRPMSEIDYEISRDMSSTFASFMKNGVPDENGDWKPYTEETKYIKEFK